MRVGWERWGFFILCVRTNFNYFTHFYYLYILREFRKLVISFFIVKNIPKLINQQLKNRVKIVRKDSES